MSGSSDMIFGVDFGLVFVDKANEDIPTFSLFALGIESISCEDGEISAKTDTSALREALSKGLVRLSLSTDIFGEMKSITVTASPVFDGEEYICYTCGESGGVRFTLTVGVREDLVRASISRYVNVAEYTGECTVK